MIPWGITLFCYNIFSNGEVAVKKGFRFVLTNSVTMRYDEDWVMRDRRSSLLVGLFLLLLPVFLSGVSIEVPQLGCSTQACCDLECCRDVENAFFLVDDAHSSCGHQHRHYDRLLLVSDPGERRIHEPIFQRALGVFRVTKELLPQNCLAISHYFFIFYPLRQLVALHLVMLC